jgi:SSS family solute:Na+ symporter
LAAAIHHGLTLPAGATFGIKGGWLGVVHIYRSEMAQNFWAAIFAWSSCFIVTIVVSLLSKPREESELVGLVYSLTEKANEDSSVWYKRVTVVGSIVLGLTVLLNIIFW